MVADNVTIPATGTGDATPKVATRAVTYSGDAAQLQVVALATVSGSDDAKTVADVGPANPLPVVLKSTTGTLSNVASSATSVTLLASNAARLGASIYNDSIAVLYAKKGATASATSYTVQIPPGGLWEVPFGYTGIIDGLWASANGTARVTEDT